MRTIFIVLLILSCSFQLSAQGGLETIELNWINLDSFQEKMASFPDDRSKSSVVIYADEITTGDINSILVYRNNLNCPKNIFIFANYIHFTGRLKFFLLGKQDTSRSKNPIRDGGNLVIAAQKAEFANLDVLQVMTSGSPLVTKDWVTEKGDSFDLREGGSGGSVYFIFKTLEFDDSRIIANAIDSLNMEFKEAVDQGDLIDTSGRLSDWKEKMKEDLSILDEMMGKDFIAKYNKEISSIKSGFQKEVDAMDSWKKVYSSYDKSLKTFLFDMFLLYIKESLNLSRDFSDLNKLDHSEYKKYFPDIYEGTMGNSKVPVLTANTFFTYYSSPGNNFAIREKKVAYGPLNTRKSDFHFYNDLNTFTRVHTDMEEWAGRWAINILKNIKFKLETAIKNTDYSRLLNLIGVYNNLPDITVSRPEMIEEYTGLLKDLNTLREKNKSRMIPEKNNTVQVIQDGNINFYSLPGQTLTKNYWVDGREKLGILLPNLEEKSYSLTFTVKMIPRESDRLSTVEMAKIKGGKYAGMLDDWRLDSFEMPDGISNVDCSISKKGEFLTFKVSLKNEDRIPLALLLGNGNFMVKLNCVSNLDPNYKFEVMLPVNFRYRVTNDVSVVNDKIIQNTRQNEITLIGAKDQANNLIGPFSIPKNQSVEMATKIQPLLPEMIENSMATDLKSNYGYFEDLSSQKLFIKDLEITNNFPLLNNGIGFEEMQVIVQYFNGVDNKEKELKLFFTKPRESQTIPLIYTLNDPGFRLKVTVRYENQTFTFQPKTFSQWHIILDNGQLNQ